MEVYLQAGWMLVALAALAVMARAIVSLERKWKREAKTGTLEKRVQAIEDELNGYPLGDLAGELDSLRSGFNGYAAEQGQIYAKVRALEDRKLELPGDKVKLIVDTLNALKVDVDHFKEFQARVEQSESFKEALLGEGD